MTQPVIPCMEDLTEYAEELTEKDLFIISKCLEVTLDSCDHEHPEIHEILAKIYGLLAALEREEDPSADAVLPREVN